MWKRIAKYGIAMLLLLWMLPCTVQAANNTYDTAYPLTIGDTVVDGAAYYVYTNSTQQYEILTVSSTLISGVDSDPYVQIFEKKGSSYKEIAFSDDYSGRNFQCMIMLAPGKTVYVYARAYGGGLANYNMHASKKSFSATNPVNGAQTNVINASNLTKCFTVPTSGYYALDIESGSYGGFVIYNIETNQTEYSDHFSSDAKCGPVYLVAGYRYLLSFDFTSSDGQASWKFVKGTDLNDSAITVGPIPAQEYTGEEIEPETIVYYNGKDIVEELNGNWYYDYINNNIDVGTAIAEIYYSFYVDGERQYGYYMTTFDIKKDMSAATVKVGNLVYSGKSVAPSTTVTFEGKTLRAGTDYKVIPDKDVNAGTRTATIQGTGNYMGTIATKYVINKANQTITVADEFIKNKSSKKFDLKATAPGALSYQTSSKKIATVNSAGKVTLKKKYGTADITINAAATPNYNAASKTVKITVTSKATKISSVKSTAKKKATVKIKKATGAQGYEVSYSLDKEFKSGVKTTTTKKTTATLKKLKSKKTYYVRVRSYRKVGGKKLYSEYSAAKKVKIK